MSADTEINNSRPVYAQADIDGALLALAVSGSSNIASESTGISDRTIRHWRNKYAERYHEIATQHARQVEETIIEQARTTAIMAGTLERDLLQRLADKADTLDAKDLSASVRNLSTSKGINVDKLLTLTGRPTQVTEHRNADDLLRKLDSLKVHAIQGGATELDEAQDKPGGSFIAETAQTNGRELTAGEVDS